MALLGKGEGPANIGVAGSYTLKSLRWYTKLIQTILCQSYCRFHSQSPHHQFSGTMNGMIQCCFPRLTDSITRWQQMRSKKSLGNLPKDLVPEILSRLPLTCVIRCKLVCKQWCAMIGTQFFLEMHYNNQPNQDATFALVSELPDEVNAYGYHDFFFSMNRKAAEWKRFEMLTLLWVDGLPASSSRHLNFCQITLVSSYKGFLLITTTDFISELALILYNPLTGEEVSVVSPVSRHAYCGFFFHTTTKEYTVLYQVFEKKDVCVGFEVYGLQTRSLRKINTNNFSAKHHPDSSTPVVISNGCLYWMVSETHHMKAFGIFPSCSEAILSFEIESEEFRLMPHPPLYHHYDVAQEGRTPPRHNKMHLLEMEGQLCLCNGYSQCMEIWVMEDYTKWIWVKRHVVKLHLLHSSLFSSVGVTYADEVVAKIEAVQIHQGELLLKCNTQQFGLEYFLYRFKRGDNKDFEQHSEHDILSKYNKHFQVAIDRIPIRIPISDRSSSSSSDEEMVRRIAVKNMWRGSFFNIMVVLTHSLISLHKFEPRRLQLVVPFP